MKPARLCACRPSCRRAAEPGRSTSRRCRELRNARARKCWAKHADRKNAARRLKRLIAELYGRLG